MCDVAGKIEGLYDLAYSAFVGTSFSPDRRAADTVKWIEQQLKDDLQKIKVESGNIGNYEEKYIIYVKKWLNAKSRCMSVMITGAANFPVVRNQKNLNYEDTAYTNWVNWREKYIIAVFRKSTPSPEEDLDSALKECDKVITNQALMKAANKIIRDKKDEKKERLLDLGYSDFIAEKLLLSNCVGDIGFAAYRLTNNNAKVKRLKDKIITMKSRIDRKESFVPIRFVGGVIAIENDRVIIRHDEKPEQSIIDDLKSRGFRWSRNYSCWCRKHTVRALCDAKRIIGIRGV